MICLSNLAKPRCMLDWTARLLKFILELQISLPTYPLCYSSCYIHVDYFCLQYIIPCVYCKPPRLCGSVDLLLLTQSRDSTLRCWMFSLVDFSTPVYALLDVSNHLPYVPDQESDLLKPLVEPRLRLLMVFLWGGLGDNNLWSVRALSPPLSFFPCLCVCLSLLSLFATLPFPPFPTSPRNLPTVYPSKQQDRSL